MRRLIGSVLVSVIAGATAVLGAFPASAAPLPFVAVDCGQDVAAAKGQPVLLSRLAVVGLVSQAVAETPGLGLLRATAITLTFPLGPGLPVGTVPNGAGSIPGTTIADAVATAVAPMGEVAPHADAAVARVRALVAARCGMTVRALDGKPGTGAPTRPGGGPTAPTTHPVGGTSPTTDVRLYDFGTSTPRDYGAIPYAKAGLFTPSPATRYGTVSGYSPVFGLLTAGDDHAVRDAGAAQPLPTSLGAALGLPVLLAALAVSVVTGALVRTWVLRGA